MQRLRAGEPIQRISAPAKPKGKTAGTAKLLRL